MFDKSMSHLYMSFQNLGITTLLLSNHITLNAEEIFEILNVFGVKVKFNF
jgi:hypothetical protein